MRLRAVASKTWGQRLYLTVVVGEIDVVVMVVLVVGEFAERILVFHGGGSNEFDDFFETLPHFGYLSNPNTLASWQSGAITYFT